VVSDVESDAVRRAVGRCKRDIWGLALGEHVRLECKAAQSGLLRSCGRPIRRLLTRMTILLGVHERSLVGRSE